MLPSFINCSTGPVHISETVLKAFYEPSLSHRSPAFQKLHDQTINFLSEKLNIKNVFLLTGSGTLANDCMLAQIKQLQQKGLVLSNGEFGERLIDQSKRMSLSFQSYCLSWGEPFDLLEIETLIKTHQLKWVLFCHCETSTGVLNELSRIAELCKKNNCYCFADCMSTCGSYELDLSAVTMATASSGKGLASIAGLSFIFSNIEPVPAPNLPIYMDMAYYASKKGVPFTCSSNSLNALHTAIQIKFQPDQLNLVQEHAGQCFQLLNEKNILPFNNQHSKIFTLSLGSKISDFVSHLREESLVISHESDYLRKKGFCQIAFFGSYSKDELQRAVHGIQKSLKLIFN